MIRSSDFFTAFEAEDKSTLLQFVDGMNASVYHLFNGRKISILSSEKEILETRYHDSMPTKVVYALVMLLSLPILAVTLCIKIWSTETKRLSARVRAIRHWRLSSAKIIQRTWKAHRRASAAGIIQKAWKAHYQRRQWQAYLFYQSQAQVAQGYLQNLGEQKTLISPRPLPLWKRMHNGLRKKIVQVAPSAFAYCLDSLLKDGFYHLVATATGTPVELLKEGVKVDKVSTLCFENSYEDLLEEE